MTLRSLHRQGARSTTVVPKQRRDVTLRIDCCLLLAMAVNVSLHHTMIPYITLSYLHNVMLHHIQLTGRLTGLFSPKYLLTTIDVRNRLFLLRLCEVFLATSQHSLTVISKGGETEKQSSSMSFPTIATLPNCNLAQSLKWTNADFQGIRHATACQPWGVKK